jgi:ATP-dependent protease ClpP protease subunit
MARLIAHHSGQPLEQIQADSSATAGSPPTAPKYGLVDKVLLHPARSA